MREKYRVTRADRANSPVSIGDYVFEYTGHDFGMARGDFMVTKISHKSVTLDPDGKPPFFTIPNEDLDPKPMQEYAWTKSST